jgi:putative hydrolase of HD superfamily
VTVDRIADFLFEIGMLKRTPRTGWQFLAGAESESVADHSFRVAMIAFALARMEPGEIDADRILRMALVHDLPEARTGDLNYMNQKYVQADEEAAAADLTRGLPFADELDALMAEYRAEETPESVIAHDADQLELLLQLVENRDGGVPGTDSWVPFVLKRLRTSSSQQLAQRILHGDSTRWWFDQDSDWWVRGGKG